jgi:hypothetical protein
MSAKDLLEKLVQERVLGPSPTFTVFDILKALETVAEFGSIGRGLLSEKLELGEGATRTLVSRLMEANLVTISKSGCTLTKRGKRIWEEIKSSIPLRLKIEDNELTFAAYNVAILIRNHAKKVGKGLEERDAAVRVGASGATTLIYRNSKLILPTISADASRDYPKAHRQIVQLMNPMEDDVVIICCGETLKAAEYGALAAAWTLL